MTSQVESNIYYANESEWKQNEHMKVTTFSGLNSKADLLMSSLGKFYTKENHIETLIPIINGESSISLRVIDWFVTNYAKDQSVMYTRMNEKKCDTNFMVYLSYKSQLKAYSKKTFDPFCRRERIVFSVENPVTGKTKNIRTTVGQLNFFRWAIENGVIDYIKNNLADIETMMYSAFHGGKRGKRKKRAVKNVKSPETQPNNKICAEVSVLPPDNASIKQNNTSKKDLTLSATSKINKHNVTITVKFD